MSSIRNASVIKYSGGVPQRQASISRFHLQAISSARASFMWHQCSFRHRTQPLARSSGCFPSTLHAILSPTSTGGQAYIPGDHPPQRHAPPWEPLGTSGQKGVVLQRQSGATSAVQQSLQALITAGVASAVSMEWYLELRSRAPTPLSLHSSCCPLPRCLFPAPVPCAFLREARCLQTLNSLILSRIQPHSYPATSDLTGPPLRVPQQLCRGRYARFCMLLPPPLPPLSICAHACVTAYASTH
jgi:hypothetical protein